jgi:hypothetical protein
MMTEKFFSLSIVNVNIDDFLCLIAILLNCPIYNCHTYLGDKEQSLFYVYMAWQTAV